MINRRQAIKTVAIATSLAIPITGLAENPESLPWKFNAIGIPPSDDPLVVARWEKENEPLPNLISFVRTFKGNENFSAIMVDLNNCSIETIDWQTCNIKLGKNQVEVVVRLDINEYDKLKNYVYKFQFEKSRKSLYSYGLYGFNWNIRIENENQRQIFK